MSAVTIAVTGADRARADAAAARSGLPRIVGNGRIEPLVLPNDVHEVADWLRERADDRVIVVWPDVAAHVAVHLLRAGAAGVLSDTQPQWLLRHATAVAMGEGVFLDPWVAHDVADLARPRRHNLCGVTGREQQVLVYAARGLDTRGIAGALDLSADTVKGHLRNLQRRLDAPRRELIRSARSRGLLPGGTSRADAHSWDGTRGVEGLSVFVVGHERLARETLAGMLRAVGARVVGQGETAVAVRSERQGWTTTLAVWRPGGGELLELRSARPDAALVVIPWTLTNEAVREALAARAQGVVGVNARLDELLGALRAAACGGLYLDSNALRLTLADVADDAGSHGPLTSRQHVVLTLVARGCTNRQIARELGLAEPTVKGHVRSVLRALGASDRREAVEIASAEGIVGSG